MSVPDPLPGVDDLALALACADRADALTLSRFGAADLHVATKPDLTPVTDADLAVEAELRGLLAAARPGDAVLGEEGGATGSTDASARRWVIDPVDGTKNFARGVPVWATLLALCDAGGPAVAVVSAPALGRRWWASRGGGAYASVAGGAPRRLAVSDVATLADASLAHSSVVSWQERLPGFLELCAAVWRTRGYGDFWSYCLLAEGAVDLAAEPEVSLWDLAAPALVVTEAGGRFTDLSGSDGPGGGSALASNGRLHAPALALLGAPGTGRIPADAVVPEPGRPVPAPTTGNTPYPNG